jgi:hypothetical protein
MTLAKRETPEMTKDQTALAGLSAALTWEHPREKTADPIQWAPRTIIYPEEMERVMEAVMTGRFHTLQPASETIGAQIASLGDGREKNVAFVMLSYDEVRKLDPLVTATLCHAQHDLP